MDGTGSGIIQDTILVTAWEECKETTRKPQSGEPVARQKL